MQAQDTEATLEAAERTIALLIEELERYHFALELVAFHEPQDDERAEAMRQIARRALLAARVQSSREALNGGAA